MIIIALPYACLCNKVCFEKVKTKSTLYSTFECHFKENLRRVSASRTFYWLDFGVLTAIKKLHILQCSTWTRLDRSPAHAIKSNLFNAMRPRQNGCRWHVQINYHRRRLVWMWCEYNVWMITKWFALVSNISNTLMCECNTYVLSIQTVVIHFNT